MTTMTDMPPTIVFTPGAWHGTWAFDTVRDDLSAMGYDTKAVQLPSVGATNPSVGLAEDVAALAAEVEALADTGRDVVMVLHSYGGLVGSNAVRNLDPKTRAAAGKPGGVVMLLYMTAFAIPPNTSLLDALGGTCPSWVQPLDGGFMWPDDIMDIFYYDVPPDLAARALDSLAHEPSRIFSDKSAFAPWTAGVPVGYLFTLHDRALGIAYQRQMQAQFPAGSFTYTFESGHAPFMSMASEVAKAIDLAVMSTKHEKKKKA